VTGLLHRSDSLPVDPELGDVDCCGYDPGSQSCSAEWVVQPVAGCVHEHVGVRALCAVHAGDLRNGWMLCGDCLDHPTDPHKCTLSVLR